MTMRSSNPLMATAAEWVDMELKDCCATLGVGPTAAPEEIEHACRKLARKYRDSGF
jgi:hypothetical protein